MKPVLTCLAIYLIYRAIDFSTLALVFQRVQVVYILPFLLISYPLIWVSAKKWSLFLPDTANKPTILTLMKMYTISYFANLFLPSSIGGDAVRSLQLGRYLSDTASALVATFYEKYSGLMTLVGISFLGSLLGKHANNDFVIVHLLVLIVVSSIFFVLVKGIGRPYIVRIVSLFPLPDKVHVVLDSIFKKRTDHFSEFAFLSRVFAFSVLFYFLTIVNTYIGLLLIGSTQFSFFDLMCVVPVVLFISMLPLTPGAIGVQEGAFMYFLARIGVPTEDGLALAVILRIKTFLLAGVGWYYYAAHTKKIAS